MNGRELVSYLFACCVALAALVALADWVDRPEPPLLIDERSK